ncbi:MAG: hypothetical protein JWS12_40 [Candidatus Saccharibacteria bacterium]|nr:hypothetical protein [Candidatus Saccharibacteria bacterium]
MSRERTKIEAPVVLGEYFSSLAAIDRESPHDLRVNRMDRTDALEWLGLAQNYNGWRQAQTEFIPVQFAAIRKVGLAAVGLKHFAVRRSQIPEGLHSDPWRVDYDLRAFEQTLPQRGIKLASLFDIEVAHGVLEGYTGKQLFTYSLGADRHIAINPHRHQREGDEDLLWLDEAVNQQTGLNLDTTIIPAGTAFYSRGNALQRRLIPPVGHTLTEVTASLTSPDLAVLEN